MKTPSSLVLIALALLIAGGAAMFWKSSSSGDNPNMASFGFQDWLVSCRAVKDQAGCGITQKILDQRSGQPVLQLAMASTQAGAYQLAIVVPLGVSVPDGVTMQVGDVTRKIAYTQCLPGGCVAPLSTDAALIDKMRSTTDARIAVIDRTGKPIAVPFSLKGFGPAFDKMDSKGGLSGADGSWWTSLLGSSGK